MLGVVTGILFPVLIGGIVTGMAHAFRLFVLECRSPRPFSGILTVPFLNLAISEMQQTSDWPTHHWNVMSEQRESNRQHPDTYYWEWEKTPGTDECDTSQHPHPHRTLPTKAVQIIADRSRDVVLEAVYFLVEIGNPRHSF
jgi:hypothetical protein